MDYYKAKTQVTNYIKETLREDGSIRLKKLYAVVLTRWGLSDKSVDKIIQTLSDVGICWVNVDTGVLGSGKPKN